VIYAVLLALVVIAVWEEYQAANETVEQEANALAEVFWLGHQLPESEGTHLQKLARSYAEEVVHKEWPLMEQGKQPSLEQEEGTPSGGGHSSTRSARTCRVLSHARTPKNSSTRKDWTRSRASPTPGECGWSRPRRAFLASFGPS
jgi:hypothetical protein